MNESDDSLIRHPEGNDAVFELSPQGRTLYEQMLSACSQHAGRPISGEEISTILRKMRSDLKVEDVDFRDPKHMERFKKEIALLGGQ